MADSGPSFERTALNRVTFGARDVDVALLLRDGWPAWVADQLAPPTGDDPELDRYLRSQTFPIKYDDYDDDQLNYHWKAVDEPARPLRYLYTPVQDIWKLTRATPWKVAFAETGRMDFEFCSGIYIRAAHSRYQLREFMTDFWLNHFSVGKGKGPGAANPLISYDRDVVRPNVFGNFRTLLEAVCCSTSMMWYLDNAGSSAALPNENYARELMELHTMGASAYFGKNPSGGDVSAKGFTDEDILQASRALSGWTIQYGQPFSTADDGSFFFNSWQHSDKAGRFLGFDLSSLSGQAQGHKVLDLVANHPATAPFICAKICRRMFGDTPPQAVIDRAVAAWNAHRDKPDHIKRVLSTILLDGPEIGAGPAVKVRRPFERFIAMVRATDTVLSAGGDWPNMFWDLNDAPFVWPTPDGRPDLNTFWLSTYVHVVTWQYMETISYASSGLTLSFAAQTPAAAFTSPAALVDYWVRRMIGYPLAPAAMDALVALMPEVGFPLPEGGETTWNERFGRRIIATIAAAPEFVMR
jgi:uncharacterized protein (DUF1800 family)